MDAYSSYIKILSEARVSELRKEAADYALYRAVRGQRSSLWARIRERRSGKGRPTPEVVAPLPLPVESRSALRRSA